MSLLEAEDVEIGPNVDHCFGLKYLWLVLVICKQSYSIMCLLGDRFDRSEAQWSLIRNRRGVLISKTCILYTEIKTSPCWQFTWFIGFAVCCHSHQRLTGDPAIDVKTYPYMWIIIEITLLQIPHFLAVFQVQLSEVSPRFGIRLAVQSESKSRVASRCLDPELWYLQRCSLSKRQLTPGLPLP